MKKFGFGLMRLPVIDGNNNKIDYEKAREMIDKYMANGFTYFDTAYMYHGGESEKAFGELVAKRYPRSSYILTDKMPVMRINSADEYPKIFAEQLQRCQVEYFDYYFLHAIGMNTYRKIQEHDGFGYLKKLKEEGKIKHIGFSFHDTADVLDKILTEHPETELVQLQINYIDWEDDSIQARKNYEVCMRHGVDVAIMEPLKGGSLVRLPEKAKDILSNANPNASIASWGLRFATSLDKVVIVLSGMSNMEQLEDNMSFMSDFVPLSESERNTIDKVVDIINESIAVACTGCRYCVDGCPKKIAIPEYFAIYNNQSQFGLVPGLRTTYNHLKANGGAPSDCINCRKCVKACPQQLDIPLHLAGVTKTFEG